MKTVLLKRVPLVDNKKDMNRKLFSLWGREAYIKPNIKTSIELIKTKKDISRT